MSVELFLGIMIIASVIVYLLNIFPHIRRTDIFYNTIDEMITNYFKVYPNEDNFYFIDLVKPERVTMWQVWVTDYNHFILDFMKLEELFKVNKKFLEDEKKEEDKVSCPWCGNNCPDKFIFKEYTDEPGLGTILCADCYSSFPPGKLKDGEFIFEHNEKLEEYNS